MDYARKTEAQRPLAHEAFSIEADGIRTRNHRIDSRVLTPLYYPKTAFSVRKTRLVAHIV